MLLGPPNKSRWNAANGFYGQNNELAGWSFGKDQKRTLIRHRLKITKAIGTQLWEGEYIKNVHTLGILRVLQTVE